jgi:DNA mismatch repair protein MutL
MISNGMNLFTTPGRGNRQTNIQTIYSPDIGSSLIPISESREYYKIEGYVSKPSLTKTNRKHQIFFVNGRSISSKVMEKGLENAYFDKIFEGRFPVGFLFLTVDPSKVDVNIHPNKKEVRFDDDKALMDFMTQAIRSHLNTNESISDISLDGISAVSIKKGLVLEEQRKKQQGQEQVQRPTEVPLETPIDQTQVDIKQLLSTLRENESARTDKDEGVITQIPTMKESATPYRHFDMRDLTLIGTVFNTYVLATLNDHLYLIDQHAAHERIFFEKLMNQYGKSEKTVQHLLIPFMVHVSLAVKESSLSWLDVLKNFGYEVEEFGVKAYRISGIPAFMSLREAEDFVLFFVENINEETNLQSRETVEKIMSRACKSAIKAGDHINMVEMAMLISQLSDCENPYSCPHGRPTFIKLTKHEIERMFKRV